MDELAAYDYDLPPELIAQEPLAERTASRLLVVDRTAATCTHSHISALPTWLRPGDLLVLNDTRVVPARLIGKRTATGGNWEGLFLRAEADGSWRLIAHTRGKLLPGEQVTLLSPDGTATTDLRLTARDAGGVWTAWPVADESTLSLLERFGRIPLPGYIRAGQPQPADRERYQTVYAKQPGAVAAPTAGLHFTPDLLAQVQQLGVGITTVTLHVGLGTFRPISAATLAEHKMHAEWGELTQASATALANCRAAGGRIVAIGTTAVRVLESAAAHGWGQAWSGWTELFIRPGYTFRSVDALLTNFHLPRSTLLVLVQTLGGSDLIRRAYAEAITERYRFYSYGDAMLIV